MKTADRDFLWDVMAGSAAVLVFVGFNYLGRFYHGTHGLSFEDLVPLSYLFGSLLTMGIMRWRHATWIHQAARFWMLLSFVVGLAFSFGVLMIKTLGTSITAMAGCFLFFLCLWVSTKASVWTWFRLRRVVAFVPGLFVITPMIAGYGNDVTVVWLEGVEHQQTSSSATVILLLDELNARDTSGLQQVLKGRGLQLNFKPIWPVHGSTTEVLPAIFSGLDFKGARACGLTRVCADNYSLDFAQVSVKRNDVDVVGFHHPYCAIQGLRSCKRFSMSRSIWEDGRFDCSLQHRLGINVDRDEKTCQQLRHIAWHDLREKVIEGLMNVPSLKMGGVVFAHVPLPHPPSAGTGTLAEQYAINLKQTEKLLGEILDRMLINNIEPRVMIFSDHPLRPAMWCSKFAGQFDSPCLVTSNLVDDHVPLIVAAKKSVPSISHVTSNQQVFEVLRGWLQD